ncbi:MAG: carbohydrate binding family 9 domain-containing protein, partial [Acidobacteria bacterium]|nr:carbohydrate binding family 9 domain-containing protein [Acidobacteriota bacterium]
MRFRAVIFLFISTFSLGYFCAPSLKAKKIYSPPKIDGLLTEDMWKDMESFSEFTQSYPNPGNHPTFKTDVKIAYDEKNIYIGVYCYDDNVSLIDRSIFRRDRNQLSDSITVQLDPYKTNREAYGFVVTSSSSIADFFVYNEFSSNWEWNGVWEGKASINSDGWSLE